MKQVLQEENAGIRDILLTHWHHDHVGGVGGVLELNEFKDCKVWKFPRYSNEPQTCPEIPTSVLVHKLVNGQEFKVEGAKVKIVHTPGHTSDHVSVILDNILFSGDCILGEGTAVFDYLFEYMKSLELLLTLDVEKIYPAHGNVVQDAKEKIQFYIEHRKQRENDIMKVFLEHANQKYSALDIVKVVYKQTPENLWLAAAHNVTLVMVKLVKDGKVCAVGENDDGPCWQLAAEGSKTSRL